MRDQKVLTRGQGQVAESLPAFSECLWSICLRWEVLRMTSGGGVVVAQGQIVPRLGGVDPPRRRVRRARQQLGGRQVHHNRRPVGHLFRFPKPLFPFRARRVLFRVVGR